jgi:predicted membrane protein (TIGR00267 family)
VVHAIAPVIAALIPVIPYLILPTETTEGLAFATYIAIALTLAFLFTMGAYLGSMIKERVVFTGLRFVAAGLMTAAIIYVVGGAHI